MTAIEESEGQCVRLGMGTEAGLFLYAQGKGRWCLE